MLSAVLEDVRNPDCTIAAIRHVARPGAILYLHVPQGTNLMTSVGAIIGRITP